MTPLYDTRVIRELIADAVEDGGRGEQTRLAETVGVRVQTVNKWVKGQTSPEPRWWPAIEAHFGWPNGHIRRRSDTGMRIIDDMREIGASGDYNSRIPRLPPAAQRYIDEIIDEEERRMGHT